MMKLMANFLFTNVFFQWKFEWTQQWLISRIKSHLRTFVKGHCDFLVYVCCLWCFKFFCTLSKSSPHSFFFFIEWKHHTLVNKATSHKHELYCSINHQFKSISRKYPWIKFMTLYFNFPVPEFPSTQISL